MLSAIALVGTLYLSYRDVSRIRFLIFILFGNPFMLTWRVFFRLSYKAGFFDYLQASKVLIIGAGVVGREFEEQINAVSLSRLKIIGFLDDDPS